jgi:hypothetical protein
MNMAVLDFGKTNSKLLVFRQDGSVLHELRTKPNWLIQGGFRVLDDAALHDWAVSAIEDVVERHGVEGLMVSGHGCTEVSYLGCHSHRWAPRRRDFSSLVEAEGWRPQMRWPEARRNSVLRPWTADQGCHP